MSEITVAKKKFLAIERAKHRLQQRLETIDFEEELTYKVAEFEQGVSLGELPQFTITHDDPQDNQAA